MFVDVRENILSMLVRNFHLYDTSCQGDCQIFFLIWITGTKDRAFPSCGRIEKTSSRKNERRYSQSILKCKSILKRFEDRISIQRRSLRLPQGTTQISTLPKVELGELVQRNAQCDTVPGVGCSNYRVLETYDSKHVLPFLPPRVRGKAFSLQKSVQRRGLLTKISKWIQRKMWEKSVKIEPWKFYKIKRVSKKCQKKLYIRHELGSIVLDAAVGIELSSSCSKTEIIYILVSTTLFSMKFWNRRATDIPDTDPGLRSEFERISDDTWAACQSSACVFKTFIHDVPANWRRSVFSSFFQIQMTWLGYEYPISVKFFKDLQLEFPRQFAWQIA